MERIIIPLLEATARPDDTSRTGQYELYQQVMTAFGQD